MAAFTLRNTQIFPDGTSIGAYPATNWTTGQLPPSGAAPGSTAATATMTSGVATFTGLTAGTAYYAGASVGGTWRYIGFTAPTSSSSFALAEGQGLLSQNFDRQAPNVATIMVGQTVYHMLTPVVRGREISELVIAMTVAGATMSLSKGGLYTAATAPQRLAISADQGTAWESVAGSTQIKRIPLLTPYTPDVDYLYASIIANGGTLPTLLRGTNLTTIHGPVASGIRPYGAQTAQTDLPSSSVTDGAGAISFWVGLR